MKRLVITIAILCIALVATAQKHYTLKECGNDPLKYIEKNYEDNAYKYVGKTIGFWADECQIKLEDFTPGEYSPWGTPDNLIGKIEDIRYDIYYMEYRYNIYIYISPTTPLSWQEAVNLEGDYDEAWGNKFYEFYKNARIKKVEIVKIKGEEYDINYRRP